MIIDYVVLVFTRIIDRVRVRRAVRLPERGEIMIGIVPGLPRSHAHFAHAVIAQTDDQLFEII